MYGSSSPARTRPPASRCLVSDTAVPPITLSQVKGPEFHRLWGSDTPPRLPTDGARPPEAQYFPMPGGYRLGFFTLPPDGQEIPPDLDIAAMLAEVAEKLPGMFDVNEPDNPGMHTTDTVDFEVVLSGEVWLELDDGAEVHLSRATASCRTAPATPGTTRAQSRAPCSWPSSAPHASPVSASRLSGGAAGRPGRALAASKAAASAMSWGFSTNVSGSH